MGRFVCNVFVERHAGFRLQSDLDPGLQTTDHYVDNVKSIQMILCQYILQRNSATHSSLTALKTFADVCFKLVAICYTNFNS